MRIAEESFGAIAVPFHRTPDLARRPDADRLFRIDVNLRAETAANVGRDDAELMFRRKTDESRENEPRDMRVLTRRVKDERIRAFLVFADGGARLHGIRYEAVVDEFQLRHVLRCGERFVGRRLVAEMPVVDDIVRGDVVDLRT